MQAVVKMPRIEITGETIPAELLDFLKKTIGMSGSSTMGKSTSLLLKRTGTGK